MDLDLDPLSDIKSASGSILTGTCPITSCKTRLYFGARDASVECSLCGQRYDVASLQNVQEVKKALELVHLLLRNLRKSIDPPKQEAEDVKAMGLSNYECKLLAPLLTFYGMDRRTGKAKLLKDLLPGNRETFDCSALSSKSFQIDQQYLSVSGYGRDRTGSQNYLCETLEKINAFTNGSHQVNSKNVEFLVPIHADGDGHCLVHAVSRALVGRELFWHALRLNLKSHLLECEKKYKELFGNFLVSENSGSGEWQEIVEECDVDHVPQEGEMLGMRNIHIFGLANVLRRPIILLDSLNGLQSSGDYSGIFLPALHSVQACKSKNGDLNKPICLAWSSMGHNHYIALVPIKDRKLPRIPDWMIPKVWGLPQHLIHQYIKLENDDSLTIAGGPCLQESYIKQLVNSMEEVFLLKYYVSSSLVADVHHYCYKSTGILWTTPFTVLQQTVEAVRKRCLYRCIHCHAILQFTVDEGSLAPGGELYILNQRHPEGLQLNRTYKYPEDGLSCTFNGNKLVVDYEQSQMPQCTWCSSPLLRKVRGDGTIEYVDKDHTMTRSVNSNCACGYKHYYSGREYDNIPNVLELDLEWNGEKMTETVLWFQNESDLSLNSNAYDMAREIVQRHFPGEFGSERLVQRVVDRIFTLTARLARKENIASQPSIGHPHIETREQTDRHTREPTDRQTGEQSNAHHPETQPKTQRKKGSSKPDRGQTDDKAFWKADQPSKMILTGFKKTTMHKEELTRSNTEKKVLQNVKERATLQKRSKQQEESKSTQAKALKIRTDEKEGDPVVPDKKNPSSNYNKIRVSISDGRQSTLNLLPTTNFGELQDRIAMEFQIDPANQRFKYGFPPKLMTLSSEDDLPLVNGDRITVEIVEDKPTAGKVPDFSWPLNPSSNPTWSGFDASTRERTSAQFIESLAQLAQHRSNPVTAGIQTLRIKAAVEGKDFWPYVQTMPHLFSVGGLFYEQVKMEFGLHPQKHITLPSLPQKIFCYNKAEDRLDLCLEPSGHYPVSPGIDGLISKVTNISHLAKLSDQHQATLRHHQVEEAKEAFAAGSSGAIRRPDSSAATAAFTGQGHTMQSGHHHDHIRRHSSPEETAVEAHMPRDLTPEKHHRNGNNKVRAINSPLSNTLSSCVILEQEEEEGEAGSEDSPMKDGAVNPQRIGPGYSVVGGETEPPPQGLGIVMEEPETEEDCSREEGESAMVVSGGTLQTGSASQSVNESHDSTSQSNDSSRSINDS